MTKLLKIDRMLCFLLSTGDFIMHTCTRMAIIFFSHVQRNSTYLHASFLPVGDSGGRGQSEEGCLRQIEAAVHRTPASGRGDRRPPTETLFFFTSGDGRLWRTRSTSSSRTSTVEKTSFGSSSSTSSSITRAPQTGRHLWESTYNIRTSLTGSVHGFKLGYLSSLKCKPFWCIYFAALYPVNCHCET